MNVLVAWGCMVWVPANKGRHFIRSERSMKWHRPVPEHWPTSPDEAVQESSTGVTFTRAAHVGPHGNVPPEFWIQCVYASGWPFIALESENRTEETARGGRVDYWGYGQSYPLWIPGRVKNWEQSMLPLRPVLPGFVLGTLVWGVASLALAWGCVSVRRGIRRRSGRCEMCGYDLKGTPTGVCPECGVRPRGALPLPD